MTPEGQALEAIGLIGVMAAVAVVGWLWALLRDGKRRRNEFDAAWKIKKTEIDQGEGPWPPGSVG